MSAQGNARGDRKGGASRGFFDEWARGRVISKKQQQAHRADRQSHRASSPSSSAGKHQAVVKVAGWGKSQRAARQTAAYITRTRAGDAEEQAIPAYTDGGATIPPDKIQDYIKSWDLKPDSENLSKAAQEADPAERRVMDESKKLAKRQSGHMIFSIPAKANANPDQVREAVQDTLRDTLGAAGVKYIYVIHTDHSARPHAHVMFSARNDDKKQIRMGPEDLRAIRGIFAKHAQERGIPLIATAREDRRDLAQEIAEGRAPLREKGSYVKAKREGPGRSAGATLTPEQQAAELDSRMSQSWGKDWRQKLSELERKGDSVASRPITQDKERIEGELRRPIERKKPVEQQKRDWLPTQAPIFAARHGPAYEQRRAGIAESAPKPSSVELPALHPKAQAAVDRAFSAYDKQGEAKQRWLELYAEKPRFAVWAVNNRPELFGNVKDQAAAPKLSQKEAQIPQSWREKAARAISEAAQPAPYVAQAAQRMAESARRTATVAAVDRRQATARTAIRRAAARHGEIPGMSPPAPTQPTPPAPTQRPDAQMQKRPSWWQRVTGKDATEQKPQAQLDRTPTPHQPAPQAPADKRPSWWRRSAAPSSPDNQPATPTVKVVPPTSPAPQRTPTKTPDEQAWTSQPVNVKKPAATEHEQEKGQSPKQATGQEQAKKRKTTQRDRDEDRGRD